MEYSRKGLNICLVASRCCTAVGGQEAYNRCLGDFLALQNNVIGISRYKNKKSIRFEFHEFEASNGIHRENWDIYFLKPKSYLKGILYRLNSLYTRPMLNGISIYILRAAYGADMCKYLPEKLDVVHYIGAGRDALSDVALNEGRKKGAIIAVTPSVHPGQWADSPLDVRFYNKVDLVFALSQYEKDYLVDKGVRSTIEVIYHAPAAFNVGNSLEFKKKYNLFDKKIVLFIGRKQKYKGYHVLCEAFIELSKILSGIYLVAIGPDSEPPYPTMSNEFFLDLGQASEEEKADALAAADIFCMPSEAEAFGITYLEAWANSLPVICGGAPAVKEIVSHGVNGFRVENQNKNDLMKYIYTLATDDELCKRMGLSGKELIDEKFNWLTIAEKYTSAYNEEIIRKKSNTHG